MIAFTGLQLYSRIKGIEKHLKTTFAIKIVKE